MLAKVERRLKAFTRHLPPPKPRGPTGPTARQRWLDTARPNQLPPQGSWLTWLILAGRGFGKTRTGAETIAQWARETPNGRFALIGQTYADARDVMVEGESGLLSVFDSSELRGGTVDSSWNRSLGELYLANGAKFKIYSSEKPRQLRGPQHHGAWGDEPATWNDADQGTADDTTWSNLLFGLRLGDDPRVIMTGTPRPNRLVRELLKDETTTTTRGSTYDNLDNLSATFRKNVIRKYEGTRLGRQELDGEVLDDTPGALWQYAMFGKEGFRLGSVDDLPTLTRIVVGVDPSASSTDESDETGIIVAAKGADGHAYVLADATLKAGPTEWAQAVKGAYDTWKADRVVAERNNGGEMVEAVLRTVDPNLPVTTVWASRGKATRAEPVAALYEQEKVHHLGNLSDLEGQAAGWVPGSGNSPDRVDALVWALTELMLEQEGEAQATATDTLAALRAAARRRVQ
ncbi:terminase family protein (plasmid) [Deinococcus sp. VB142]|uniref:Terminase family protein n=1 Tax=Deinococcus sp. VB142 TaxID=3112952 RepID=A0AAU6Q871_9DEIO